jgi:hypothetical protein
MINPWRLATAAVFCELGVVVWLAVSGSANGGSPRAAPALDRVALLTANLQPVGPPKPPAMSGGGIANAAPAASTQPVPMGKAHVGGVDIVKAAELLATVTTSEATPAAEATPVANDVTAAANEPEQVIKVASADPSQALSPETTPAQAATISAPDQATKGALEPLSSVEIFDECFVADACIDRYLFALYQRTPKEDSVKVDEQRKVTVKRKGKTVTVTRTVSNVVDEDFAWKDRKAAEKVGMSMMDYVIGGVDRGFKLRLFHVLRAAEAAGLSPGITSAFRDDYRQSIASGLHAASDRSYHGGSFHGGYGHGLAADIVSVKGGTRAERQVSSENLWKWVDVHGAEFGIGRPYLDRDPPHMAPIDGEEYAKHRGTKTVRAGADAKKPNS